MELSNNRKLLIAGVAITAVIVTGLLLWQVYTIRNYGRIKSFDLDIYASPQSTNEINEINWGTVKAGSVNKVTLYAKNTKNTPFTMSFNTSNWQPFIAEQYLSLQWTYSGQTISPDEMIAFDFILTVSANVDNIDHFSFDINIKAEEVQGGE